MVISVAVVIEIIIAIFVTVITGIRVITRIKIIISTIKIVVIIDLLLIIDFINILFIIATVTIIIATFFITTISITAIIVVVAIIAVNVTIVIILLELLDLTDFGIFKASIYKIIKNLVCKTIGVTVVRIRSITRRVVRIRENRIEIKVRIELRDIYITVTVIYGVYIIIVNIITLNTFRVAFVIDECTIREDMKLVSFGYRKRFSSWY